LNKSHRQAPFIIEKHLRADHALSKNPPTLVADNFVKSPSPFGGLNVISADDNAIHIGERLTGFG
jgi:hypothetical protein